MSNNPLIDIIDEIGPGFAEGAAQRDADDTFVADHYPILKERGLLRAMVPESLGGLGASHSQVAMMLRRLGRYDGATALALSMHQHLVAAQLFRHKNGLPAPLLSRVANENLVLVSTGARDWLTSNGEMRKVDGGFRVNAHKAFASGSPAGDIAVTSAPYEDPDEGWQVLHFGVPMKAEGVRLQMDWEAHGMRATGSNTVVFEDVFVPDAAIALRRPRYEFHPVWNVVLTVAMPLIVSAYVGVAERAAELGVERAGRRRDSLLTQLSVGEMQSQLLVTTTLQEQMVRLADDANFKPSLERTNQVLILKTQTVNAAQRTVNLAVEAAGGSGFYRRTGIERLLRDIRASSFHPLAEKPQLELSGRVALGLDPFDL